LPEGAFYESGPAVVWDYFDWVYAHRKEITESNFQEKLNQCRRIRSSTPLSQTCVARRSTEADVKKSIADGLALEVSGYANFIPERPNGSHGHRLANLEMDD
jgi:hypothetical protein